MKERAPPVRGTVRCAIYTRKSSEEGLEQDFNSLDAQREACAAYVLSQASEGWMALPDRYDDGGVSGGTLERPALKRLLADVASGRIDTVVVYKVDRLSRSLFDFAKLVEALEKAGTSFVSVTQSFNTTSSMGRLTLNMLLSFAQFEREVTAERIRDKIAASKAKGMWMGGIPPLGYAADGRSLKVVTEHAALVQHVFARYLVLGNVRQVAEQLAREGRWTLRRTLTSGKTVGGGPLTRGQIYKLLSNPTYIGEVHHKGKVYAGSHIALIGRETWDRVQQRIAENRQGHRRGVRAKRPSLLAGKLFDAAGMAFMPTHATKGTVRYRYYVRPASGEDDTAALRIPAAELEALVAAQLCGLFDDLLTLVDRLGLGLAPNQLAGVSRRSAALAAALRARDRTLLQHIVERIVIHESGIGLSCNVAAIAARLGVERSNAAASTIALSCAVRLTRTGRVVRLVDSTGAAPASAPDASLVSLIARAHRWWHMLRAGEVDITRLAASEDVQPSYLTRVLRLAFLSPAVIDAVLRGQQHASVDALRLTRTGAVDPLWSNQARELMAVSISAQVIGARARA